MPQIPRDSVSVAEAAEILGTSVWTVSRKIRRGELRAVKAHEGIRAPYLVSRADINALLSPEAA